MKLGLHLIGFNGFKFVSKMLSNWLLMSCLEEKVMACIGDNHADSM